MPERTVFRVLEEAAEQYGNAPALNQPYTENGKRKLRTLSWIEYRTAAEEIAAGLRALGIRQGRHRGARFGNAPGILPGRPGHPGQRLHRRRAVSQLSGQGLWSAPFESCDAKRVVRRRSQNARTAAGRARGPSVLAHRRSARRPHARRSARVRAATPWRATPACSMLSAPKCSRPTTPSST